MFIACLPSVDNISGKIVHWDFFGMSEGVEPLDLNPHGLGHDFIGDSLVMHIKVVVKQEFEFPSSIHLRFRNIENIRMFSQSVGHVLVVVGQCVHICGAVLDILTFEERSPTTDRSAADVSVKVIKIIIRDF